LIRRIEKKEVFGLTTPLITSSSGAKMGKTEKGAIWLNKKLFSPYDYWQFWRNTEDKDVVRFLKYFTEIKTSKLDMIIKEEKNINNLKILLANEATKILHGNKSSMKSQKTARDTFELGKASKNLPEIKINYSEVNKGLSILELLSRNNILPSKSEARRAIKNNGIKINDIIIEDEQKIINLNDFKNEKFIKLSFGKKRHFLLKII